MHGRHTCSSKEHRLDKLARLACRLELPLLAAGAQPERRADRRRLELPLQEVGAQPARRPEPRLLEYGPDRLSHLFDPSTAKM